MFGNKFHVTAVYFTVLGLFLASCAPAVQPAPPTAKPPVPAPTGAPATGPTAAATAKPAAPAPTPKPAGESRPESGRYGGILTAGFSIDPPSLDIHREESSSFPHLAAAHNGLVKYDPHAWPEAKIVPDLATSWDLSPDGKVYTFHLVRGAKFHNGSPVTAEDVKYSLDRIRDPQIGLVKSPRRTQIATVTSVDTPDDYTVKITLGNPQASFVSMIAGFFFAVMPKHLVLEKKGDMTKTLVGTGAFKFKDYSVGVGLELVKNPDHFVKGRPYLDGIKGYIIPDTFARFAALRTKNILWWVPTSPYMTVSQAKVIEEQLSDKIAVKWEFHPAWYGVMFNVTKPPWSDVRLRQAVSMSLDRKRMLEAGLQGAGVVGMAAHPPGEWTLPEEEMMKAPGYAKPDIEGAKKLLAEAGFPNGFKTEALVRSTAAQQAVGVLFKDAVAPIGVAVDLNLAETAVFNDRRFRRAFDVNAGSSGYGGTDPDFILSDYYLSGSERNYPGYSSPQFDELFARQSRTLDVGERRKIVWEMQRILLKDVPIAIAYWSRIPYAWWKEVRGYTPPSLAHYYAYQYEEMWLAR
ncbi:MAG: hypothetical protein HYX92_20740 [Chloroflexi bacterium]|nr:hypothetical protein [Chloroflexota bacterium]